MTRAPKQKSPMHVILSEVNRGINTANGALSKLWRTVLRDRNINGHQWERLLKTWQDKAKAVYFPSNINFKKNNLVKSLASGSMTWKVFMQGLQVLNSTGLYKSIRFEIHFVHAVGDRVDKVGIDVVDRTNEYKEGEYCAGFSELRPGDIAEPGEFYVLKGFKLDGITVKCTAPNPMTLNQDAFDNVKVYGNLMFEDDGMINEDWAVINPLMEK